MKRLLCLLTALLLVAAPTLSVSANTYQTPPPETKCEAAILLDYETGDVLYEKNADLRWYPASLTKMITALVLFEALPDWQTRTVTAPADVNDEFAGEEIGTADILGGETLPLKDAVYALLLPSAAEAAKVIAYAVDGSDTAAFVARMNALCQRIGAVSTHYENVHGLFNENHYSTARDQALIARYAMHVPQFYEVVTTAYYTMSATNLHSETREIHTANDFSYPESNVFDPLVKGVKTGTLESSGRNFISTKQIGDRWFLLACLGDPYGDQPSRYEDHKLLYDWAFSVFRKQPVIAASSPLTTIPVDETNGADSVSVYPAQDYAVYGETPQTDEFELVTDLPASLTAPLAAGSSVGTLTVKSRRTGAPVFKTALVIRDELVEKAKPSFPVGWFVLFAVLILAVAFVARALYVAQKRRKRRRARERRNRYR